MADDVTVNVDLPDEPEPTVETPTIVVENSNPDSEIDRAVANEARLTSIENSIAVLATAIETLTERQVTVELAAENVQAEVEEVVDAAEDVAETAEEIVDDIQTETVEETVEDNAPKSSAAHWLFSDHPIKDRRRD